MGDAVSGSIEVTVAVEGDRGSRTAVTHVGNVYDFTALAAFSVAQRLLLSDDIEPGLRAPSEVIEACAVGLELRQR